MTELNWTESLMGFHLRLKVYITARLGEPCLPCLSIKLKCLCLANKKRPDQWKKVLIAQSCSTLWDPMDCSLPAPLSWNFLGKNTGAGCHFLLQGIFQPRDWAQVSCTAGRFFTIWATREALNPLTNSCRKKEMNTSPGFWLEPGNIYNLPPFLGLP